MLSFTSPSSAELNVRGISAVRVDQHRSPEGLDPAK
jgi:hypothetical protein